MTDKNTTSWPLASSRFVVMWDSTELEAMAIDGLTAPTAPITSSGDNGTQTLPGQTASHIVTLQNCVVPHNHPIFDWINSTLSGTIEVKTVQIALRDTQGATLQSWTMKKAYPFKVSTGGLNARDGTVTINAVEFAYDTLT
mmetsp:Transcript_26879/g.48623  ORF Transcript_26879/g.48623 Transcript_26879/m.48623 type:complete len:141 (+) Transcript_26879:929-1351(+)